MAVINYTLNVTETSVDKSLTLRIKGDFMANNCGHFRDVLKKLTPQDWEKITIDLTDVTFMDSVAIGLLFASRSLKGILEIETGGNQKIFETLALLKMDKLYPIHKKP